MSNLVTLSKDKVSTIQKGSENVAQLVIWNAAKEYTEVMNLESGRVSNATITSNKGTWDKAGSSIQQSVDYNGVKMDATNGINVVSSQNTLLLNASKGIELKKKSTSETLFSVDTQGNLVIKGNVTMVGGSIQWSSVTAPDYSQVQGTKPPTDATNTWSDLTTDARYKGLFYTSNGNLVLKADAVVIGSNTKFDDGYDPSKIEIGSTNLIENGAFLNGTYNGWTLWGTPPKLWVDSQNTIKDSPKCISMDVNAANQGINQSVKVTVGKQYTMSAWVWCKTGATLRPALMVNNNNEYPGVIGTKDGVWERLSFTFTAKNTNITAFIGRNGGAGTGTYSFVSVQLEEGNRVTDWKPSAKDMMNDAGAAIGTAIDNVNIGGKNLILKSNVPITTTNYLVGDYTLSENWVAGQEYTFVIKGTLTANQIWGLWVNGSANRVAEVKTAWINGLMYVTFKCIAITAGFEKSLRLYNTPQNTTNAIVEWVALYKGNKPMDWSPAPEDVNQNISDSIGNVTIGAKNMILESGYKNLTPWILPASVKVESGVMPNDVLNLYVNAIGTAGNYTDVTQYIPVEGNTEYTFSCNAGGTFSTFLWEKKADKTPTAVYKDNMAFYQSKPWDMSSPRSDFTRTIKTQPDTKIIQFIFRATTTNGASTSGRLALAKLEKGNKVTDYSPAPEDATSGSGGGRNLLLNSQLPNILSNNAPIYPITVTQMSEGNYKFLRVKNSKAGTDVNTLSLYNALPFSTIADNLAGQQITVSHKVRASKAVDMKLMALVYGGTEVKFYDNEKVINATTGWTTVSSTFTMPANISGNTGIRFILYTPTVQQADLYVDYREWKIEFGGKATDWNPAPEDFYQAIDNIDVGGNNIIINSDFGDGLNNWLKMGSNNTQTIVDVTDQGTFTKANKIVIAAAAADDNWVYADYTVAPGDYILSAYFKSEGAQCSMGIRDGTVAPLVYNLQKVGEDKTGKNTWFRASFPVTFKTQYARIYFGTQKGTANGTMYVTGVQLEAGNKMTGWKKSADDLQGQITYLNTDYNKNKVNWGNAYSTVESWKGAAVNGVTTIKGGLLQTGTITADKLFLGDTTNLCENPDFENDANGASPTGFTPTSVARVKDISTFTAGNGSNRALEVDAVNGYNADVYSNSFIPVTPGQQFYVEAEGRFLNTAGSGIARLGFSCYGAKKQHLSVWSSAVIWNGTKVTEFTKKSAIWTVPANCYYMYIWISFQNNGEATNKFYIDNIRINRAASAEMIVDGSITAGKLNVNEIFGAQAVISKIQTYDLSANRIVSGNLEVGGSQLAVGTAWAISGLPNTNKSAGLDLGMQTDSGEDYLVMAQATANELFAYLKRVPMVGGKKVTVSYDYNLDSNVKGVDVFLLGSKFAATEANSWQTGYDYVYPTSDNNHDEKKDLGGGWFRVRKTHTLANDIKSALFRLDMNGVNNGVRGNTRIRSLMVNYGNLAMDWQPHSDEDISIGGINARHIAANSITAREILAGSITANEMSILAKDLVNNFSNTNSLEGYTANNATMTLVNDPKGIYGKVLKYTTANDVQLRSDLFEVNSSKTYRFKVSAYMPTPTATTRLYFGVLAYNASKQIINMKQFDYASGIFDSDYFVSNPYFKITGVGEKVTDWMDMEALVLPTTISRAEQIGRGLNTNTALIMHPDTRYLQIRFFHHYSKTSVDSYYAHPSVTATDSGMFTFDQAVGGTLKLGTSTGNGFLQVLKQGTQGQQETVGQIDESGAYFPRIQADEIVGSIVGIDKTVGQVFFDSVNGNDNNSGGRGTPKRNIQSYIDQMAKYIVNKIELIQLNGNIDSPIFLKGFMGPGSITVRSDNSGARKTINSGIVVDGVTCQLYIQHFIMQGQDRTKAETGTDSLINVTGSPNVDIWFCKLYGNGKVDMGITGVRWAYIRAVDIEIYNVTSRAFSIIYHATAYIKNCKGGKNPYSILSSDYAIVQGEGTRPDGTVARWANSYIGGYMGDGLSWRNDIWTVDYGEATPPTPPPPTEYVREWASNGGANWSVSGYWDDEWYVKQGDWGYGDRIGIWWFPSDMKNTLAGKTILDAQFYITRANKGGYSGSREARIVAHQYADQRPASNPLVSGEYVSANFAWGEGKWVNVTSFVQNKIASGVDKGLGLRFAGSNANYMAFDYNAKLWVKYK